MPDHSHRSGSSSSNTGSGQSGEHTVAAVESNQANLEQVQGLTGRTFNRILGAADGDKSTANQSFGHAELSNYMEKQLEFAKGEWFSGTKIRFEPAPCNRPVQATSHGPTSRFHWPMNQ